MAPRVCLRCDRTVDGIVKGLCTRCYTAVRRHGGWEPPAPPRVRRLQCPEDHSWAARGACLDYPHLPWVERTLAVTDEMRAICGACPVKAECLAEALADPHVIGVWAGTTTAERKRLRPARERRRQTVG